MATLSVYHTDYDEPEVLEVKDIYEATYELCMFLDPVFVKRTAYEIFQRWSENVASTNPVVTEFAEVEVTHEDEDGKYRWVFRK